ncbi:hypothetical protein BJX76DRAFT_321988 [Aspergillus varians]
MSPIPHPCPFLSHCLSSHSISHFISSHLFWIVLTYCVSTVYLTRPFLFSIFYYYL